MGEYPLSRAHFIWVHCGAPLDPHRLPKDLQTFDKIEGFPRTWRNQCATHERWTDHHLWATHNKAHSSKSKEYPSKPPTDGRLTYGDCWIRKDSHLSLICLFETQDSMRNDWNPRVQEGTIKARDSTRYDWPFNTCHIWPTCLMRDDSIQNPKANVCTQFTLHSLNLLSPPNYYIDLSIISHPCLSWLQVQAEIFWLTSHGGCIIMSFKNFK